METILPKMSKFVVKNFNEVINRNSVIHLQNYYGITLNSIPLLCENIYSNYGVFATYDGESIIIDPKFLAFSELKKNFIIAHEIAHFFQWKKLKKPKDRNLILNFLMELDANFRALDFVRCVFLKKPPHKRQLFFWSRLEQMTNICQCIPRYSFQFSAFGVGGVFALKQALLDQKSASQGMVVQYDGCHETLTRMAFSYAQEDGNSRLSNVNEKDLNYGSTVNDMYFLFDLLPLYSNNLTEESKEILDELEKKLSQIKTENGAYPQDGLSLIDVSKFTTAESITTPLDLLTLLLTHLLSVAATGVGGIAFANEQKDYLNKILANLFNSDLLFLKKIEDFLNENAAPHILNGLENIQKFLPIEYVLNWSGGVIEWLGDKWNSSSGILERIENLIGINSDDIQTSISNVDFKKDLTNAVRCYAQSLYCCAQFLMNSHTGDLQFLHSMDCSSGDIETNRKKCIRFAKFCTDVYLNKNNILEKNFGEYVIGLEKEDILKDMLSPLIVPISVSSVIDYKLKKIALSENAQKAGKEISQILNFVSDKKSEDDEKTSDNNESKTEQIIKIYENGKKSFFAKFTVGEFFTMKQKEHNPQGIALGMACHMLEDSFTASHTVRAFNIYNEVSFSKNEFLKKIPPIIFFADYTKQDSNQHMNADVFVVDLEYGKEGLCNLCDAMINEIRDNPNLDIEHGICSDNRNQSKHSSDFYDKPTVVQFFKGNQENHFIHSTVGAELAKKCAGHFLKLVTSIEIDDNKEKELNDFLEKIYKGIDKKSYQNEFPFLENQDSIRRAGRSYELKELEIKEFFERISDQVKEWSLANIILSSEDFSKKFDRMGEEFSNLAALGKKFENAVEEYQIYLKKCFSTSNQLIKDPCEIKNSVEEEMAKRLNEKKEIYQKIIGTQSSYNGKWLQKSLVERLLLLYSKFDIVYLEYILKIIAKIRKKITSVLDSVGYERRKCLSNYNIMLERSQDRYKGHLYEITINLIWMSEELSNLKKLDNKLKNKDLNESIISTLSAKINSLQILFAQDVDDKYLQIEYYTEALQDAISTVIEDEKNKVIRNLLTEEKHSHSDAEIASLVEVSIEQVVKIRGSLDKNQSGLRPNSSNPKIPIEAGKSDSDSQDSFNNNQTPTGSFVKDVYKKFKDLSGFSKDDFLRNLGYNPSF